MLFPGNQGSVAGFRLAADSVAWAPDSLMPRLPSCVFQLDPFSFSFTIDHT